MLDRAILQAEKDGLAASLKELQDEIQICREELTHMTTDEGVLKQRIAALETLLSSDEVLAEEVDF